MPYGYEIHLGFYGPEEIDAFFQTQEPGDREAILDSLEPLIVESYHAIAQRLGWTLVSNQQPRHPIYDTPFGRRQPSVFNLFIQHDPNEAGDLDDDISLAVNLSSRYSPTILDIEDPYGGGLQGKDMQDLMDQAALCKEELAKRIDHFKEAKVFIREIFY